jgi:hypothetical protein
MFLRHRLGDAKASRRWILLGVGLALPEGLGDTKASRRWILLGVGLALLEGRVASDSTHSASLWRL